MCICGKHTMALLEARDNIVVPFPPFPFSWHLEMEHRLSGFSGKCFSY